MREQIFCIHCDKPLSGGIDTYGNVGDEMCFDCWLAAYVPPTTRIDRTRGILRKLKRQHPPPMLPGMEE